MPASPIDKIELFHVALPPRREHKWTGQTEPIGGYILVKLTDAGGVSGWGESTALKDWAGEFGRYFGESPGTTRLIIERYLAAAVRGVLPANVVELHARMDRAVKGYPYAKAAVEIAAYDLAGHQLGIPAHMLLGGALRSRVPDQPFTGLDAVRGRRARSGEGCRGGHPHNQDKGRRRCRPRRGDGAAHPRHLRPGHRHMHRCERRLRNAWRGDRDVPSDRGTPRHKKYFEQPVEGIARMAQVARAIDSPVMADESAWNAHDVIEIIERRAAQMVSIYTTKPGGLYRAMQVAAVCKASGIVCNVNGSIETGIGNLANLHLACAAEPVTVSCVFPVSTPAQAQHGRLAGIYYKDDLIVEPMKFADGCIEVPTRPGMGIAPDLAKIRRYTVAS